MAAQECTRKMGDEYCVFHPGQKLVFECKNCSRELVCMVCVTSPHQSHTFIDLKESVRENIQETNSFLTRINRELLPEVLNEIELIISKLQETEQMCKNEVKEVKKQEDRLKELLVAYSATRVLRLEFLLKETTNILNRYKTHLEALQHNLEQNSTECQRSLKSGTDVLLHDTKTKMEKLLENVCIPKISELITSSFVPCQDPKPFLEKAFGELKDRNMTYRRYQDPGELYNSTPSISFKFLNPPRVLFECSTDANVLLNGMCGITGKRALMLGSGRSGWLSKNIIMYLLDSTGKFPRKLETNKDILSICSDPKTGNVYCTTVSSYGSGDIKKVDTCTGETSSMSKIRLGIGPQTRHISIGCTNDNHFIVGMRGVVKKIHFNGQVVKTYNYRGITVPEISVCGKTNNIALIFSGWYLPVGRVAGGGTVIVLDQSLRKLYEYSGEGLQRVFQPCTAAFDGTYLLIGDGDNILVLESGTLVLTIHTKNIRALCVQEHGVLFVGCTTNILGIKYMDTPVQLQSLTTKRYI